MSTRRLPTRFLYFLPFLAGAIVLAAVALSWPQGQAEAQCGSQATSCKNCHEVQGQLAVNADRTGWHQSHAFGDFCANCHGGNVQATDASAAHSGLVAPLSDIQTNCAACHPADTNDRAVEYAAVLGVEVGSGSSNGSGDSTSDGADPAATAAPAPTAVTVASLDDVPGLIDYNQQYAETVLGQRPVNWGNVVLGLMIVSVAAGGGTFAYFNERKLRRLALNAAARPAGHPAASEAPLAKRQAAVADLLPQLEALDLPGLLALKQILTQPEAAGGLLQTLARLEPRLIEDVRRLDRRERNLLFALAEEK